MAKDAEAARNQARIDINNNPQTPKAEPQQIPDYTLRQTYNNELDWQRKQREGG